MTYSSGRMPKFNGENLRDSVQNMHRYMSAMSEYLEIVLQNIDGDNMTEEAAKKLSAVSKDELSTTLTAGGTTWTFDEEHIYKTVNGQKVQVV